MGTPREEGGTLGSNNLASRGDDVRCISLGDSKGDALRVVDFVGDVAERCVTGPVASCAWEARASLPEVVRLTTSACE